MIIMTITLGSCHRDDHQTSLANQLTPSGRLADHPFCVMSICVVFWLLFPSIVVIVIVVAVCLSSFLSFLVLFYSTLRTQNGPHHHPPHLQPRRRQRLHRHSYHRILPAPSPRARERHGRRTVSAEADDYIHVASGAAARSTAAAAAARRISIAGCNELRGYVSLLPYRLINWSKLNGINE